MNKKEILNAEVERYENGVPPLDCFYIIPTRRKHDSGYRCIEIVGYNKEKKYLKKIATFSDVINYGLIPNAEYSCLSMDVEPENGYIRVFALDRQIAVDYRTSNFVFHTIERKGGK